jgi:prolyl-tRNA synthetase
MAHSDDDGLVLPPKIAPLQVVIIPIYKNEDQKKFISDRVAELVKALKAKNISVKYDDSDHARPGWKFNEYEVKGVPVRIAIGARDLEQNVVEIARRDTKEKKSVSVDGLSDYIEKLLEEIQQNLFYKAKSYRDNHITEVNTWDEFVHVLETKGGFVSAHWDGTAATETIIKEKTKATIRCIPLDSKEDIGACVLSGKPSAKRVLFAQAY